MFRCPCTLADLWTKKSGTCLLLGIIKKWDAFLNSAKLNEVVLSLLKAQVVALPTLRSDLPSQDSQPLTEREVYSICFLYTCKCIHTYIYNGILLSKKKKNEILPFSTTWMDIKCIMLSETNQRRQTLMILLYVEPKNKRISIAKQS